MNPNVYGLNKTQTILHHSGISFGCMYQNEQTSKWKGPANIISYWFVQCSDPEFPVYLDPSMTTCVCTLKKVPITTASDYNMRQ